MMQKVKSYHTLRLTARKILEVLSLGKPLTVKEISNLTKINTNSVGSAIWRLSSQKIIAREPERVWGASYILTLFGAEVLRTGRIYCKGSSMPSVIMGDPNHSIKSSQPSTLKIICSELTSDQTINVVQAIFDKIEEVTSENRRLKEENDSLKDENRQFRILAGKEQSRSVRLPDYAMVINGEIKR